jgi:Predicted membrane protein (DUF2232)
MVRLQLLGLGAVMGALCAALYLTVLTGSPGAVILAYLAQLPLFAAGLWLGVGCGAAAGAAATVILLGVGGLAAAAVFAALYAAPIVVLVRQALLARRGPDGALEWYPPGLLTAWLTGLGLAALGGGILFFGGPSGIEPLLHDLLAPAINRFAGDGGASGEALIHILALVTPGAIAASWMAMTASNAILAQGVLARFGKAWRPSPDPAALSLPLWVSAALAAAAMLLLMGGPARYYGINMLIVLSVPFCLAGLAVLHAAVRRLRHRQVPLTAFYVLAGLFGWPLMVIIIVGVLDAPLGLRRRLAAAPSLGGKIDD